MSEKLNIYQRINKVREGVAYLQKDKAVDNKYRVVTHDLVTASVRPHFIAQGVVIVPSVIESQMVATGTTTAKGIPYNRYEARYDIRFVNIDDPKDFVQLAVDAHAVDDADKAPGKALSYATKYAMLKVLNIETGEDDESRVPESAVAGDEEIEAACDAIADAKDGAAFKKAYAAAVAKFAGHKAALKRIEAAKDAKLALAAKKPAEVE